MPASDSPSSTISTITVVVPAQLGAAPAGTSGMRMPPAWRASVSRCGRDRRRRSRGTPPRHPCAAKTRRPPVMHRRRMQVDLDRGDDAERAARAARRPEQLGLVGVAQPAVAAVGREQLDRPERARGEAVRASEPRVPAAERERRGVHDAARSGHRDEPGARERLEHPAPLRTPAPMRATRPRRRPRRRRRPPCARARCRRGCRMPRARSAARRAAARRRVPRRAPPAALARSAGAATAAGCWSIARFHGMRTSSQRGSPGSASRSPRSVASATSAGCAAASVIGGPPVASVDEPRRPASR